MSWTWNPNKAAKNKAKHRVSFETAELVFGDPLQLSNPDDHPDGDRWVTTGVVGNEGLLTRLLARAIECQDDLAVINSLAASVSQYERTPGSLVPAVFFPAVSYLSARENYSWARHFWFSWRGSLLLKNLSELEAQVLLSALLPIESIQHQVEEILAVVAGRWPKSLLAHLGDRLRRQVDSKDPDYRALPFRPHSLAQALEGHPELTVQAAREWYALDRGLFRFRAGRFLATVFSDLPGPFERELQALIDQGSSDDLRFVVEILKSYDGNESIHDLAKSIIAQVSKDDEILREITSALYATGVVWGEFGFVDAHEQKKRSVESWLHDERSRVRNFAQQFIRNIDQSIAAEQRRAEEDREIRKRDWGEDEDPS